jgi:hypothetical protein
VSPPKSGDAGDETKEQIIRKKSAIVTNKKPIK